MSSKEQSNPLFGVRFEQGEQRKKPTILQFVKTLPKDIEQFTSTVELIWLPGNFNNYTLECEHFRVSISATHPLFGVISENIDALTQSPSTLDCCIESKNPLSYVLVENTTTKGTWHFIGGDSGIRYFPEEF